MAQISKNTNHHFVVKNKIFIKFEKLFFQILIVLTIIFPIVSKNYINDNRILQEELQTIEIVVNATEAGEYGILSKQFTNSPNYIYVNESISNLTINNTILLEPNIYLIKIEWNRQLIICDFLFSGLPNIIQIDFRNFNTSKVVSMKYMFEKCIDLKIINFGNKFDTSSCNQMQIMFFECNSLISLDLTFFNTSLVNNMAKMFYQCNSLVYLNISSFDTSQTTDFNYMFYGCKSLISLDLSNFKTQNVTHMNSMFSNCQSLLSLNLSNFNTQNVTI
jgi:surface protein